MARCGQVIFLAASCAHLSWLLGVHRQTEMATVSTATYDSIPIKNRFNFKDTRNADKTDSLPSSPKAQVNLQ